MKGLLSGAMGVISLALLVPVIAPCLCSANQGMAADDCCPPTSGFEAALSKGGDCCVAPVPAPTPAAEANGTPRAPFVAVTVMPAVGHEDSRIVAQSHPHGAPLPGAARPLLNLRI